MRPQIGIRALVASLFLGAALSSHAQALTHRYSFKDPAGSTNFSDSIGGAAWEGSLLSPDAPFGQASLNGSSLELDGEGDYATLPPGIISNYTQVTVEFWADFNSANAVWARVFAFGSTSDGAKSSGIDYCHYAGGNYQNLDDLSIGGVDAYANSTPGLNGLTNVHVVVVVDPVDSTMYYYNGHTIVSTLHGAPTPISEIDDTTNMIGSSFYSTDPTLDGAIHEFRIYSGVLSASQVALNDASGPANLLSSPGAIISLNFGTPINSLQVRQSIAETLTGDFSGVTNLDLVAYGGVTYTSGNTNVVTVNSNGLVTGTGSGSATVIATYGTVSATNTFTVQALPTQMTHRYSFTTDASDSIEGANGTLEGNAQVTGGQLVLDGSSGTYLSLPGNMINISTNASVTFEAWTTIGAISDWSHLFEFGAQGTSNIYCAPRADSGGFDTFGLSEGNGSSVVYAHGWSNVTVHYVGVVDPTTSTLAYYSNGVLVQAIYSANLPLTSISTNLASIGQSTYGDPYAVLSVDEFRIYSGVLTPIQVAMSDISGPNSTNLNPGALNSLTVAATNYPAFGNLIAPVIWASYANVPNFNLLPNDTAREAGLVVTSSDTNIITVNPQNMLATHYPGSVTLTAAYGGKTNSAVVQVINQAVLTHRYSFTSDASDSIGGANGTLVGTANIASNQVQLDGGSGDYVSLPPGLLSNYDSATIDTWATITSAQQHWARLWEFDDSGSDGTGNELYFAPAWNSSANQTFLSFGSPGGNNIGPEGLPTTNQTVHLTCVVGDGILALYTNAILYGQVGIIAPASQAGIMGSWIGYSPYGDPGISGSVDEYRIYNGRLSPDEILASDILGPNTLLATNPAPLTASATNGEIVLSFPLANAGYSVQTTSALGPQAQWTTVTNTPTLVNSNQWEVIIPNSGGDDYYRLIK